MCSIVGSFSKVIFKNLIELNQNRGSFSYSFLVLNPATLNTESLIQNFGKFDTSVVDSAEPGLFFGHCQAPTGGLIEDPNRIHPAKIGDKFLFHNGIIKQKDVTRLQKEHNTDEGWDSKLMIMEINKKGLMETLNTIDGSFACVYKENNNIFIFRSQAGTLFVDENLNISSTKFNNAQRIKHDTVFKLNLINKSLDVFDIFKSKSSPYFY